MFDAVAVGIDRAGLFRAQISRPDGTAGFQKPEVQKRAFVFRPGAVLVQQLCQKRFAFVSGKHIRDPGDGRAFGALVKEGLKPFFNVFRCPRLHHLVAAGRFKASLFTQQVPSGRLAVRLRKEGLKIGRQRLTENWAGARYGGFKYKRVFPALPVFRHVLKRQQVSAGPPAEVDQQCLDFGRGYLVVIGAIPVSRYFDCHSGARETITS